MNKYLNLLTNKIYELYRAFEDYAFSSYVNGKNNYRVVINLQENNTIHIILFEGEYDKQIVDEVYIGFDKARNLYEAVTLRLFAKILGNVTIYPLADNMYYNPKYKPYSLVIADDQKMNKTIKEILLASGNTIDLENEVVVSTSKKVKMLRTEWAFLSAIEDRTEVTKKLQWKW